MVQNYRYLNEWTIKNNYFLPLILDILEKTSIKKVFTKLDIMKLNYITYLEHFLFLFNFFSYYTVIIIFFYITFFIISY